ncbi:MAG: phosphonate C-P lyase system protein PhnL [Betaproteobacteria bacterium]|nr:phosphonate C-P lyase system protein PhnL [Betaproteobacteria bacterium]MBV9362102.1 phosphonate C-P lyase system protein PhnL [Betaproteobacteria bacterium]
MIAIRELKKTFVLHNQGGVELPVLEGVSLDVAPGECVALEGPSGAGKSTLLKCIYGNYGATTGSVRVADTEVTEASDQQLLRLRRETIGYVSQFLRAIPRVPAIEVVAEPLDDPRAARHEVEQLLLRLRVPMRLWSVPPATFSGGEQQRINIARSFVRTKPVLLLDEPTASLDAENRITVTALINEARAAGAAIVGVFHDPKVRDAVATRSVDMTELAA